MQQVRQLLGEPCRRVVVRLADFAEKRPQIRLVKWQCTCRDDVQANACASAHKELILGMLHLGPSSCSAA